MTLAEILLLTACIAAGIMVGGLGILGYAICWRDEARGNLLVFCAVVGIATLFGVGFAADHLSALP